MNYIVMYWYDGRENGHMVFHVGQSKAEAKRKYKQCLKLHQYAVLYKSEIVSEEDLRKNTKKAAKII